ncbi:MAG: 16S rRNA (cytosine(967)-C(5))-methyltransferase RsmB [Ruminococcaceae bacterium]|nr:16S rRNA (cytosine(967)-C(5))-methyltransferase RsmB [Oscillospiraceae bacterium]
MNVRELALATLDRVTRDKSYSNIAVDTVIKRENLTGKDRSLFCVLVYGVIEKKITLDYLIDALSSLSPEKIEPSARNLLRMGLYQLRFLDRVPDHAAVSETVNLAPRRTRGFVNAILRSYLRQKETLTLPKKEDGTARYLSVLYSYPEEFCEKLLSDFGEEKAEAILAAFEKTPALTLRVNTLKTSRDALLADFSARGLDATPTENAPHGIRVENATPTEIGLEEGLFFVQDEASQIASAALGARAGDTIYDICACPGSKSFGAALDMENKGCLLSFDLHENKLSLVKKSAERLGITILKTEARDGRDFDDRLLASADRIICDVPCSGFGVVAKKPEIRYKELSSCETLPAIQYDILNNACRYLKPGGTLLYSTCTIFREENEDNVARFLREHPDFSLTPFRVGNLDVPEGQITLLPCDHGTDGFFIAKFTRKESFDDRK